MSVLGQTLVLSSNWTPINVIPVLDAVIKVFNGRALFLHPETYCTFDYEGWVTEWDEAIRTAKVASEKVMPMVGASLLLPEVIVCSHYRGFGFAADRNHPPKYSRRNLLFRDRMTCQFCGKRFPSEELTQDHVIPKSKGGPATWENIVLSCVKCNHKKANRTPEQAGMRLLRKPFVPKMKDLRLSPADRIRMKSKSKVPKTWEDLLSKMYWDSELLVD